MKSNAPWSVKGIERDARETAKEAARRQGMTVGEWLNQMIYTAGDPEGSDGNIEGLKVPDLVTAIEHLNKRLAEMESSSAVAFSELSRNVGGIVERTQRLERTPPGEGGGDLAMRIEKLEQRGGDRQRVDALKALEKAVAQVAVQFNNAQKTSQERIDATEQQIQQLAERIDESGGEAGDDTTSGVAFLKDAFDGLSARVARAEKIAGDASRLKSEAANSVNPEFVEQTGARLRVLGDEIKRGGDQIRALEGIVTKLSEQIDAAELRSAEGIQKVTESIADLAGRVTQDNDRERDRAEIDAAIETARQEADARITKLQDSLDEAVAKSAAAKPAIAVVTEPTVEEVAEPEAVDPEETKPLSFDISDDIDQMVEETVEETEDPIAAISDDDHADTEDELGSDPFSLEDDNVVEAAEGEQSDDFSFDFDDEDETTETAESEADEEASSEARALLSEVRQAFGAGEDKADEADESEDDDAIGAADIDDSSNETDNPDDLDSIFAELDAIKDSATPESDEDDIGIAEDAAPEGTVRSVKARAKALLSGNDENTTEDNLSDDGDLHEDDTDDDEDFLKAARRRAQEAAAETADSRKRTRRNLTPKQKAILAARARQKRRAEREESLMSSTPAPAPAFDADDDEEEEGEEKKNPFSKIAAALGSITKRNSKDDDADDKEAVSPPEVTNHEEPRDGDKAAFATLKSTITARPVTMALGVAIILAAAALFFLVKDLVFKPSTIAAPGAEAPATSSSSAAGNDAETVASLPAAPAINPRTLYAESMTALNAAADDAQIADAIVKLQDSAALGFPPAQLQLGELYKTGQGLEQDLGQARIWFRRAANGGNVLAMHRIGVMTARGDGGAADTREAISWFERAASFGLVDSQYNLGAIFHPSAAGDPTPVQDAGQAYFWYSLAANSGDQQAGPLAAGVAGGLSAEQRQDIDAMIASWVAETPDPAANEIAVTN